MNERILIVEDDRSLLEIMTDYFRAARYDVTGAKNGTDAICAVESKDFDMILLDINLPDTNGFEVCRYIRSNTLCQAPILFITARVSETDKLNGYACGGDDYITKPFSLRVLDAKIKAILQRNRRRDPVLKTGLFEIDTDRHAVKFDGTTVQLARKEFELLVFLVENRGRLFTREALLVRLWGYDYEGSPRAVDDHIRKLRKNLGPYKACIQTIRGGGYRFEEPEAGS